MATFESELRRERERSGMTLDGLSERTKVNLRYFEALERGDFHELPGGVFRKGILRSYLVAVGLEEGDWLTRFESIVAEHSRLRGDENLSREEAWFRFASNVKRNRRQPGRSATGRWVGVGALLLLLGGAMYAVWIFQLRGTIAR